MLGLELGAIHTPALRIIASLKLGGTPAISQVRNPKAESWCNVSQVSKLLEI